MAFRGIDFTCGTSRALAWTFTGTADAMQSLIIENPSGIVVTVGGPDVDDGSLGVTIAPNARLTVPGYSGDQLWIIAASGAPVVRMLANRV
jgi:hypothetical protein